MTAGCPNRQRRHTPSSWTTPNPDTTLLGLYFQQPARASGRGATKSAVVFARGGDKVPRDCKHVARVKADQSEFSALFEAADKYTKVRGSDRWAEIQPGYMAFHFASYIACFNFCTYLARRGLQLMTTEGNDPGSHDV